MNIATAERTIVEYTLTLSADDAAKCVADPWEFGEALANQLRATVPGLAVPAKRKVNGNGNGHNPKAKGRAAFKCADCDKPFKYEGHLNRHRLKAHGSTSESPAASA